MTSTRPRDPRTERLTRDGAVVDGFRVAGLVTEQALKASLRLHVGMTGLKTSHLPHTVLMALDGHRREQHVLVHEEDRSLAVRAAKGVRVALLRAGVEVNACVVRADGGAQGEDHDIVQEVVDCEDAELVIKKLSGEVKLRRLRSAAGRDAARRAFDRECVADCVWWQREARTGRWGGRIVAMVNSPSGRATECDIYADFYPVDGGRRGHIGWPCARRSFQSLAPPRRGPPTVPAGVRAWAPVPQAPRRAAAHVALAAAAPRRVKKAFPKLKMRRVDGVLVGELAPVLEAAFADKYRIKERHRSWLARCPGGVIVRAERGADKKGGSLPWCANQVMLQWCYDNV